MKIPYCKFRWQIIILFLFIYSIYPSLLKADYFISLQGNDAWSGKLPEPNAAQTDGPFATILRARDALRGVRPEDKNKKPLSVLIREGTYYLKQPLVFLPQDSGTSQAPITYTSYPGEKPIISGGKRIAGVWQKNQSKPYIWEIIIPEVAAGKWYFNQLFVNGERRRRASTLQLSPGQPLPASAGYFKVDLPLGAGAISRTGFIYSLNDINPAWHNLADVQLVIFYAWCVPRRWLDVDLTRNPEAIAARKVFYTTPTAREITDPGGGKDDHQRYYVDNVFEALDNPGEWYLDRQSGKLSYYPQSHENLDSLEFIAPILYRIVEFAGDRLSDQYVNYLKFENLSFHHAEWYQPTTGRTDGFINGEFLLNGGLHLKGARNIIFTGCEIAHVGEFGAYVREGSQGIMFKNCHIHDLGSGGVRIGEYGDWQESGPKFESVSNNSVENCRIHDGGHIFHNGPGICIGKSSYNRLAHNEIYDFYYSGITVGWVFGLKFSTAHDNIIEFNHIYNMGRGVLGDLAGIYTLGNSPGTIIKNNLIHNINHYPVTYGGWGIYFDQDSQHVTAENNIVYNTSSACLHDNMGQDHIIKNNIFAFSKSEGLIRRSNEKDRRNSFTITYNIFYNGNIEPSGNQQVPGDLSNILYGYWNSKCYQLDYNIYFSNSNNALFNKLSFEEWKAFSGQDQHSQVADPLFININKFDFRLKPESPANKIGFQAIDVSRIGIQSNALQPPSQKPNHN